MTKEKETHTNKTTHKRKEK